MKQFIDMDGALKPKKSIHLGISSKYLTLFLIIIASLSPALFFSFGFHNDFNGWSYNAQSCCTHHPETLILNAIGRYFGAIAQNFQFLTIHNVGDFWLWRFIGILSTALLASYYLWIISLGRKPNWVNVFLTIVVFTLPTMQFQAIWVSMYMFWTPPILLSLIATHLFLKAILPASFLRRAFFVMLGFFALLAGVFFYPASATFVLVPVVHLLLTRNSVRLRLMARVSAIALGFAFVALFVIHKFIVLPRMSHIPYLGEYEFKLTAEVIKEIAPRLSIYLWDGAYFWLGVDISWFPKLIGLVAILAFCYSCVQIARRLIHRAELINVVYACGLFLVAAAPFVVVQQFTATFRIVFAMTAIELLVFFWLVNKLPIKTIKLAGTFAVIAAFFSFVSTYGVAESQGKEYALYKEATKGVAPDLFTPIAVLRTNHPRQAFGYALRKDFGGLTMIHHVFDQLVGTRYNGKAAFDVTEFVLPAGDGAPAALEDGALIIDTSVLYNVSNFKPFTNRVGVVSAKPRGIIGPMYAVDGNANTFWEVCNGPSQFPIEFKLILPNERELTGYSMSTVEEMARMPNAWEIWVTSDSQNWLRVQQVEKVEAWKVREVRNYKIEPAQVIKGIKLVINGTDSGSCFRLYEFKPSFTN